MQSVQESKQELEASIRYAENAISSAKKAIASMEFRQEIAKKQSSDQTGREESLTKLVKELEETNEKLANDNYNLEREVAELRDIIDRMSDDATGDSVTIKLLNEENANLKAEVNALEQPEQALEAEVAQLKSLLTAEERESAVLKDEVKKCLSSNSKLRNEVEDLKIALKDQHEFDEEVRQGINDFLDTLDTIGYERP